LTANRAGVLSRARMGLTGHNRPALAAVTVMTGALLTVSTHVAAATTKATLPTTDAQAAQAHATAAELALAHATALWHQEQRSQHVKLARQKRALARATRLAAGRSNAIPPQLAHSLANLRQCESTNNYQANTGNGFYGAYQFDLYTWRSIGMTGLPHQASPARQDLAAAKLHAGRGWQPWPVCGRSL
jgi:hypothetical protein